MKKYSSTFFRIAALLALCLFLLAPASCGGGGGGGPAPITGPGLVGLDDTTSKTAPLLIVDYHTNTATGTASILSDLAADGDIAFDPALNTLTVTQSPSEVLFGEDSSAMDLPEYRAFLSFPLSSIPTDAVIDSATLEVFVDEVDFASTIPTFVDLIQYQNGLSLSSSDFDDPLVTSTSYRALDFYSSDAGQFVDIDVTGLMTIAQANLFSDFQVRFGLQSLLSGLARGASLKAKRSVNNKPRELDKIQQLRSSTGRPALANTAGKTGAPVSNAP